MNFYDVIIRDLNSAFAVNHLYLENESYMHNVPANSETHFKLVIVSDDFCATPKVKRHQSIYSVLSTTMKSIHALSIQAFTLDEFKADPIILKSPDCAHK